MSAEDGGEPHTADGTATGRHPTRQSGSLEGGAGSRSTSESPLAMLENDFSVCAEVQENGWTLPVS